MRTIVVADAVMGIDNVLAVGGAAQGSFTLVVIGLAISIPIVVWGSALVLRMVDRFPSILWLGAAVLGWTAAKMISGEPLLRDVLAEQRMAASTALCGDRRWTGRRASMASHGSSRAGASSLHWRR